MDEPDFKIEESSEEVREGKSLFPKYVQYGIAGAVVIALIGISYVLKQNNPPLFFPLEQDIVINEGMSVRQIAHSLEAASVIRSPLYFQLLITSSFKGSYIQAGSYRFPERLTSREVIAAITTGTYLTPPVIITFPEGFKARDMRLYLPQTYDSIDLAETIRKEGYLFPDTYFIEKDATIDDISHLMTVNFNDKIDTIKDDIDASPLSLDEVVILASILEREGNDEQSMRLIAGILLDRLDIGMPLQVDATFEYLLGKTSAELTEEDLLIDSPFNTYTNRGLPPSPISNPGLVALTAAVNPEKSPFLYYLSDPEGNFHYAVTFEDHKRNKARYLK